MTNIKLSHELISSHQITKLAASLNWCRYRALGLYVHFLSTTQRLPLEEGLEEDLLPFIPLRAPDARRFLRAMAEAKLLIDEGPAPSPVYAIAHNTGLIKRRQRRQEIGRVAGQKSGAAKKAAPKTRRKKAMVEDAAPGATTALAAPAPKASEPTPFQALCKKTWLAYSEAYLARTHQPPVQNAKANRLIQTIVQQLGQESPEVLAYYCTHPNRLYVSAVYPLELAQRDAQALRTQWRNGRYITPDEVRQRVDDHAYQSRLSRLNDLSG